MAEANDGGFANTDTVLTYDAAVAAYPFVVGEYISVGLEYMLVTGVSKTSATAGTVTVVRNVNPPCLTSTLGAHLDNVAINKVVSGGCYSIGSRSHTGLDPVAAKAFSAAALLANQVAENPFAAGDVALTVDSAAADGIVANSLIQIDSEILHVTSLNGGDTTLTVTRGVAGTTDVQHADNAEISNIGTATTLSQAISTTAQASFTVSSSTNMVIGGYLLIGTEYMLITDIDAANTIRVVRNVAPPCVVGTTIQTSTAATHLNGALVIVLSLSGSDNTISTSMRAIVELSPREPIVWAAAAPAPPPSPHYVDLRVTMPYSLAEFNVPSVTEPFKSAIARVAGTTADKIVLSFPAQRRAATDTLLVDVRILADSAAEVRAILATLGADPDTLECASTCQT